MSLDRFWQLHLDRRRDIVMAANRVGFDLRMIDGGTNWIEGDGPMHKLIDREFRSDFAAACSRLMRLISSSRAPDRLIPDLRSVLRSLSGVFGRAIALRKHNDCPDTPVGSKQKKEQG